MDYKSSRLSVLDVKMGHTLLCLLGFLLLNLLYRGQAQDAVLTIEPNWTAFFSGGSVTFKCDITGGKDSGWFYSIYTRHGAFFHPSKQKFRTFQPLSEGYSGEYYCFFQNGELTKTSNKIYLYISDRNVILESPASTLFEGESVTLRCRHRTQREENAAFFRDGSLMAKNTVQVMSDGSSYSCRFGDEESEPRTLRTEPKPKAQLRDIFPGGGNATLTCSVGISSASGWRYFWSKKGKTSEPLKTQDVVFLTNDRISVSRGGVYWCRGGRGDPVYYTEYSDAVVTHRAVVTLRPNWPEMYSGETITLTCEIKDGGDSEWDYIWMTPVLETPPTSDPKLTLTSQRGGDYRCKGRLKGEMSSTHWSDVLTLTVSDNTPQPVLSVSPSWPSPGASVTLNCRVDHPSAGWSFYWYKAVPQKSDYSYSFELLAGSENGTEQHLFIIDGQTHTAGYVCRAGRGDPVFYSWHSKPAFVWSGDINSAVSLTVSPDSVQHFTETPVSLSCEGNSTEWRVRRFSKHDYLLPCSFLGTMTGSTCTITRSWVSGVFWCESETGQFSNAVNITKDDDDIILVSPVRPVAEGHAVTLSCKLKTGTVYNVDFYKNDKLIQNDTRSELTISAVSKSDEGFYKCKRRDSADGWTSPESWFSVKSSMDGEASAFPVLLIVGLLCGVSLIILLLLFLYLYRKSKDSCYSRSQRTNQGPATDHMINQDETMLASVLQDNACLYATVRRPEEPANDEYTDVTYSVVELKNISKKGKKNEPEDCVYSHVQMASAAGKSNPAPADETIYSELKPGTALGKNAA
ncbi:Fc receptor-like protein 5 isoform X2 [Pseudochaenichthys georgianus]|uniref:Fc receptor-like protein 5 isoform X2 n=1 Tax=Pseudochaenichthys georgianus TaxID=52239 RepID=UPI00146D818C|nr:Fc receptor-like protein 5 isoform X2 [Pseudochaenichthys georgianus]